MVPTQPSQTPLLLIPVKRVERHLDTGSLIGLAVTLRDLEGSTLSGSGQDKFPYNFSITSTMSGA